MNEEPEKIKITMEELENVQVAPTSPVGGYDRHPSPSSGAKSYGRVSMPGESAALSVGDGPV